MTYQKPAPTDEDDAAQQAALLALAAQTIALQAPPEHPETQQYWMTKAMEAYRRVPDRYQQILGIGLAIEALHLQQEHDLQTTLADETLSRSLLKLTCLARDAVEHVKGREPLDALSALCGLDGPPDASVLMAHVRTQLQVVVSLQSSAGKGDSRDDSETLPDAGMEARLGVMARGALPRLCWPVRRRSRCAGARAASGRT